MADSFESRKNIKALSYTITICGALLLFLIFCRWTNAPVTKPQQEDLILVNLGNETEGEGSIQPLIKGQQSVNTNQPQAREVISAGGSSSVKIAADESNKEEAAEVPVSKEKIFEKPKPTDHESAKPKQTVTENFSKPVEIPKLKVPLYKGNSNERGNGQQVDNGYRSQGYGKGNGDQGSPKGAPDSYGNSETGRTGISVIKGLTGRRPIHFPPMEDEFNENAKVYVQVEVDASGAVTNAIITRGSTTTNPNLLRIALQKAKALKFPVSKNEMESGIILFNFVLKN